jgi:hypothetical protein
MSAFEQWKQYEREVIPKEAPTVQREECRRAFYGGVAAGLELMIKATEHPDEDECVRQLEALTNEIQTVTKDLRMA